MKTRLEWRVGMFVLIALVLAGVLLLAFSKGTNIFAPTYNIMLNAKDVAGLKVHANVLISGVNVGSVEGIELGPGGRTVIITLRIYRSYPIHTDARFTIETSGFLGDEYVAVTPGPNEGPVFTNNQPATAEVPFNIQEAARSLTGLMQRVESTFDQLDQAIARISKNLLTDRTLSNLAVSVDNLRDLTEGARRTVDDLHGMVGSNTPAIHVAISNLVSFSEQLKAAGAQLDGIVNSNSPVIDTAVRNVESSTETLKSLLQEVQNGHGTMGSLIKDQTMATNVAEIVENLSITTSNLNRFGLWHFLWHHNNAVPTPSSAPASPSPSPPAARQAASTGAGD